MAVSGRNATTLELSLNAGSAKDFDNTCDPCSTNGQYVEAYGFCVECQDYLCLACFKSHSKSRASRHHELLDKNASEQIIAPLSPTETYTEKCPLHRREIIKFFCPEHETLGCNDCMVLDHRKCKIDYIPEKCSRFARSNEYLSILEELDCALENITYVQEMAGTKTQEVDQAQKKAEEDINKFQKDINDRIAELRTEMMAKVDSKMQTNKDEINKVLNICETEATDLKHVQLDMNKSINANRDGHLFISSKRAEHLLKSECMKEAEAALEEIDSDTTFQRNKDIANMVNHQIVLGRLCSVRYRRRHEEKFKAVMMELEMYVQKLKPIKREKKKQPQEKDRLQGDDISADDMSKDDSSTDDSSRDDSSTDDSSADERYTYDDRRDHYDRGTQKVQSGRTPTEAETMLATILKMNINTNN